MRPAVAALITMLIGAAGVLPAPGRASAEVFASVGTGQLNGVYYPVGNAICQIVNRDLSTNGVRCSPEATPGSVYNVGGIQSGEWRLRRLVGVAQQLLSNAVSGLRDGVRDGRGNPGPSLHGRLDLPRFRGEAWCWVSVSDWRSGRRPPCRCSSLVRPQRSPFLHPGAGSAAGHSLCQARAFCAPARACA